MVPHSHLRQNSFDQTWMWRSVRSLRVSMRRRSRQQDKHRVLDLSGSCLLLLCAMPLSGRAGQFRTSHTHCVIKKRVLGPAAPIDCCLICFAKMETNKPRFILGPNRVGRAQGYEQKNLQLGFSALQWKTRLLPAMPWSKAGSEQHACCLWQRNMLQSIGSQGG